MSTGTATVAVFDPACLEHRLEDTADWWSVEEEELQEINAGNVLFVSTHVDGGYAVLVDRTAIPESDGGVRALLRCVSGRFWVGAGEQVPAEGVLPSTEYGGGTSVEVAPGTYVVVVRHRVPGELEVAITPSDAVAENAFNASPELPWPEIAKTAEPIGDLVAQDVEVDAEGWTRCPRCQFRFKITNGDVFSDGKHQRCGQPIRLPAAP